MPELNSTKKEHKVESDDVVLHVVTSGPDAAAKRISNMRKLSGVVGVVLLLVVAIAALTVASNNQNTTKSGTASLASSKPSAQVSIASSGFVPRTISVKVGQAVTWVNKDASPHKVASDPYPTDTTLSGLNSKTNLNTNDSFSYVFSKAGTYTYHDEMNPYGNQGTVIVK